MIIGIPIIPSPTSIAAIPPIISNPETTELFVFSIIFVPQKIKDKQ